MLLGYIAAFVSLVGILLNARKNIWCWPVWLVSNVLWIYYSVVEGDIPSIILWSMFSGANLWGWYIWSKENKKIKR
jgi:nicotinamide mononucleotide transporter